MLSGNHLIEATVANYPATVQDRLRLDLKILLNRERRYLLGQLQLLFAKYQGCAKMERLRAEIDQVFLESDASQPPEAEASATDEL